MTRMAAASVFRTRADADAREPVLEEPRNRSWGWLIQDTWRPAETSNSQRQNHADGSGPYRPVKLNASLSTAFSV